MTTWRIELSYSDRQPFACDQVGLCLADAIDNAIHYAHACGWPETPMKKRAIEINQEKKEKANE